MKTSKNILSALRIAMSLIFLWAFFDKVFGLGFATTVDKAWIHGGSPTAGFLAGAVKGPLANVFHGLSGMVVIDWRFMVGLLVIGLTLLFNKYVAFGAISGIIMMVLMWLALLFPANNPLIDERIIYALVLAYIAADAMKPRISA